MLKHSRLAFAFTAVIYFLGLLILFAPVPGEAQAGNASFI